MVQCTCKPIQMDSRKFWTPSYIVIIVILVGIQSYNFIKETNYSMHQIIFLNAAAIVVSLALLLFISKITIMGYCEQHRYLSFVYLAIFVVCIAVIATIVTLVII